MHTNEYPNELLNHICNNNGKNNELMRNYNNLTTLPK